MKRLIVIAKQHAAPHVHAGLRLALARHRARRFSIAALAVFSILALLPPVAHGQGTWIDAAGWPFRRQLDVAWEPEKATGDELATAEFYTAGHAQPKAEDIRVATDDGRIVPSHVLQCGPGDLVRLVFALEKPTRRYFVFFGNPTPPAPPKGTEDVKYSCGLLYEMRGWAGGPAENFDQLQKGWERCRDVVGQTMVHSMFVGLNPFDDRGDGAVRVKGMLFVPEDGNYSIALAANYRGALWLDEKEVVFARGAVGDVRFRKDIDLKRGKHELAYVQLFGDGDVRLTMAWKKPDSKDYEVIDRSYFGILRDADVGPLEEVHKPLTADFTIHQAGETFFENHYTYRYQLTANVAGVAKGAPVKFDWEFGDGQSGNGNAVEHVYLSDGDYVVKLTARLGQNSSTQTIRMRARRERSTLANPPGDDPRAQSKIVATYDPAKLAPRLLPWATLLHERANAVGPMLAAGKALAASKLDDANLVMMVLQQATQRGLNEGKTDAVIGMWDAAPGDCAYKGRAACREAEVLLWREADFERALRVIEPYAAKSNDGHLRRVYGQALVLCQKADQGKKVLQELPIDGPPEQEAARSGGRAYAVERYITENDAQAGEEAWDRWMAKYPADFMEGYSVVLQMRLMDMAKCPQAAARVGEAFASAVPKSSYAPAMLDKASKLLAQADPQKSAALMQLLKSKYPEDPLSNK